VGTSIAGGNPLPDEGTLPITVTNISPDRDVLIRSDSIENAYNNDFRVESSIDGDLIGQSPETIGESTDAEVEIRPTVKRSNNQKYEDGDVIGEAKYKIFNDADFGPDPVNVEIQGTFQVTDVIFLDGNRTDGTEFDPETSDFEIVAGPGTVSTKTFTVQIDKANNSVSTNAVINDPQKNPISLTPDGSDGTAEDVLDVNGGDGTGSKDPDFISADVRFAPQNDTTFPKTQNILVEWDNKSQSQNITVKGIAGSTIDVLVANDSDTDSSVTTTFSDGTALIDYGDVTENEKKDAKLVVKETSGERSFNITSDLSFNSGNTRYNISDNSITTDKTLQKDTTTPSVNADIAATPPEGSSESGEVAFAHDADNVQEAHLGTPVTISLNMNVLNKAEVELSDASTDGSSNRVELYSSRIGDVDSSLLIETTEVGGDNGANIIDWTIIDNSQDFSVNNDATFFDNNFETTRDDPVAQFNPSIDTGDKTASPPDFTVDGRLEVEYNGPGVTNTNADGNATATVNLRGEVERPSTADISSGTNNPLRITDSNGNNVFYEIDNGVGDGSTLATAQYVVEENNLKNGYEIENVEVATTVADAPINATDETTYGSGDIIDPSDGNITVQRGTSETGTIEYSPNGSGFVGVPNIGNSRNTELRIQHTAFQEGPEDGSNDSKKASDPDSNIQPIPPDTSASQILAIPLSVELRGDPKEADWDDNQFSNYDSSSDSPDFTFEISYIRFPTNCVDLFVQVPVAPTQGSLGSVSFKPSQNNEVADTAVTGNTYGIMNDEFGTISNGVLKFGFQVSPDGTGAYPLGFRVNLYKKDKGRTRTEVTSNVGLIGTNGSDYGKQIASITLNDQANAQK
jgi:hypothetical protein